ncbi:MAG: flagellar biosynthesis protein FlhF [Nitrospira sp.]|nr:flagellar biosynthesis protein FlhF [Nitrospira sp.]
MKVKIFHAVTMQDAMRAIKEELGPDAIILSSKEVREGGRLLRVFNRPVLEIMAAAEQEAQQSTEQKDSRQSSDRSVSLTAPQPPSPVVLQTFQQTLQTILEPNHEESTSSVDRPSAPSRAKRPQAKPQRLHHLRSAMVELNSLMQDLSHENPQTGSPVISPILMSLRRFLIARGINPATATLLMNEAHSTILHEGACGDESAKYALQQAIARRVATSGSFLDDRTHPTIGLLLGPSGAGKTSAIAKLAAYYRLEQRKSVALISFDTYRETAVEQLRRYARIVGVPFACALSARQVSEGLRRHTRVDLVLIDMPGIGPDDLVVAKELCRLLPEGTVATHLVLSAFIGTHEARRIIRRLDDLPRLRLLFTKLDEAESLGTIFEVAHQAGVPLSYWSVGRRVPGDMEVASSERLAALLTTEGAAGFPLLRRQSVRASVATSAMTGVGIHRG